MDKQKQTQIVEKEIDTVEIAENNGNIRHQMAS